MPSSLVYLLAELCRGLPEDVTSAFALVCPLQVATVSHEYRKISEVISTHCWARSSRTVSIASAGSLLDMLAL